MCSIQDNSAIKTKPITKMKKHYTQYFRALYTVLMSILLAFGLPVKAEKVTYADAWNNQGISIKSQSAQGVSLNFSIKDFSMDTRAINGESMHEISLSGVFLPNNEGAPNLPVMSRYIAIPQGALATVEIVKMRTETFQNIEMAPAPRIPLETERGPLQYNKDLSIYNKNAFYPAQTASLSTITKIRGIDVAMLSISPYQYNPVTKELIVYRDMEVKINFIGGNNQFGDNRLRNRYWDPILKDHLLNAASLPVIDYNNPTNQTRATTATGCEYLIIVPNDAIFSQWADSIKAFRTEQGILTQIVKLSEIGGNTVGDIENYINNAYNNWDIPPTAILLMADYGTNAANSITSPIWDNYCVSDNIYGDVDNDDMPEIVMARMTANNAAQLEVFVTKFLNYERTPPTDPSFYNKPITALGWQTERWFQICSETVGGFFKNILGKDPVRINAIYQGNPDVDPWSTATNTNTIISYFGPSGLGYIPASPQTLGGWSGGNSTMVNNALNSGAFILQHRDHGMETGWGEPSYTNTSINGLTNVGKLSYIFSVNCLTGKYNYSSECFAEKFHRYQYNNQNAGCVGILAASETSYSFVNDTYVWGLYDNMWPEFMPAYGAMYEQRGLLPAFGNAAGKYFLQQSSWPYNTGNKEVTYNLFHHHGDAFLTLFSEVPTSINVSHAEVMISAVSSFSVTADAGSFIALTANGQILGTGVGTGAPVAISLTPPAIGTIIKVVVTKQNCYRHYSYVTVISPENPYVITDSYTMNDPAGNNNQKADFDEEVFLSLTEKNLGNNPAENLVVSILGSDPYITLLDATEAYPVVPSQQTVTVPDGFKIKVANNVPNNYTKLFTVAATNGVDTWNSEISVKCLAPTLYAGAITIDDSQGGNGNNRLDAGETAIIKINVQNTGASTAPNVTSTLAATSGFLTLVNNTATVGNILPLGSAYAEFTVTVEPGSPAGLNVQLIFNAVSGAYQVARTYDIQVGLLVEDWETGDFSKFNWTASGNLPWTITNNGPFEGVYSAKSGAVGHSQNSQLVLMNFNVPQNDSIKFYYKVSSEPQNDGLKFYIDNVLKGSYSGNKPWTREAFAIPMGTHTFKWVYSKNGTVSTGQDCAWLDFIVLPVELTTTSSAGVDNFVCETSSFQCQGNAANYSTVNWTTSGTGTFNNANTLNAVYTPSAADITAGSVTLTLNAVGASTSSDNMLLTILKPSTAVAGANTAICSGTIYTMSGAAATNYSQIQWTSSGNGTFSNPNILFADYTPSAEDILNGAVTLTLNASNQACPIATSSKVLTINKTPDTQITGNLTNCALTQGVVYSTPNTSGNTYNWTVTGGTIVSGTGTNSITVDWGTTAASVVSVNENTINNCPASSTIDVVVNPLPSPAITGSNIGCEGDISNYSTPLIAGNTYQWTVNGGTINSGQGTNAVNVTWNTTGTNELNVTETISLTQCALAANQAVIINALVAVPTKPTGPANVDVYQLSNSDYMVTAAANATSYVWEVLPAEAGIISGTSTTGNVVWNNSFKGAATIKVKAVNNCGESVWSETMNVNVYSSLGVDDNKSNMGIAITPNPNNGNFSLSVLTPSKTSLNIRITSMNGKVVFENQEVESNGAYNELYQLNLTPGSYNVIITNETGSVVKKMVVTK